MVQKIIMVKRDHLTTDESISLQETIIVLGIL